MHTVWVFCLMEMQITTEDEKTDYEKECLHIKNVVEENTKTINFIIRNRFDIMS